MSFFPPPEKRDAVAFVFFKALPYKARMALAALLLAGGVLAQLAGFLLPGLVLVALGSALGVVQGYNAAPEFGTGEGKWERVTPDEYRKIKEKAELLEKWDRDAFDITSGPGVALLAVVGVFCFIAYSVIDARIGTEAAVYFAADAAAVFLAQWLSGTRQYLKQDQLIIKIKLLESVMAALADPSAFQVFPMLLLKKTNDDRDVPTDARLMIKLPAAPAEFYGVQTQVSINSVKGTDFPYLYCVLLAKKGGGLLDGYETFSKDFEREPGALSKLAVFLSLPAAEERAVFEPSSDKDVDVLVVRQFTTRTGGYHTDPAQAAGVVRTALGLAEKLLARHPAPAPAA
ncbi:MAG TPA: hypothetical protein PKI19_06750 [Elusimicrobiales bacterium]|nr:hypothetical protein [Elusimicrobiales bacterium]